jgi:hypothetical protein
VSIPKQPAAPDQLAPRTRLALPACEGLQLLGVDLPAGALQPGGILSPVVYWAATRPVSWTVGLRLSAADGRAVAEVTRSLSLSAGDALRDWPALLVPRDAPAGTYTLAAIVQSASLPLGGVRVEGRTHHFDVPKTIQHPGQASFDGKITWLGYDFASGMPLHLTLYWQAAAAITDSYKTFVHVLDPDGRIIGQRDLIPSNGHAPTTDWVPGEVLSDTMDIPLSPEATPNVDRLAIGWYSEATGQRLPVTDAAGQPADHLEFKVNP